MPKVRLLCVGLCPLLGSLRVFARPIGSSASNAQGHPSVCFSHWSMTFDLAVVVASDFYDFRGCGNRISLFGYFDLGTHHRLSSHFSHRAQEQRTNAPKRIFLVGVSSALSIDVDGYFGFMKVCPSKLFASHRRLSSVFLCALTL
jgi:hypothetical protein